MKCHRALGHRAATAVQKVWLILLPTMGVLLLVASALESAKPPAQPFKVAFIGDTGYDPKDTPELDSNLEKVLALVRSEGAHLLAHYLQDSAMADQGLLDLIIRMAGPTAGLRV